MTSLGKYAIGIIIGIAVLTIYIFTYQKPELQREYKRGYDDAIASIIISPPDTVIKVDTVKLPPIVIKPRPSNNSDSGYLAVYPIDTLVSYPQVDIYIYSDDILKQLYVEPIFHETTITVTDTIIKSLSYEVDKPEPWYNTFEAGMIVGGSIIGVLAYIFTLN